MEHHTLWIVELVNRLLGPLLAPLFGKAYTPGLELIPDYLVMCGLIVAGVAIFSLAVRSSFSVDNPGKLQIILEDIVGFVTGLLKENIGPQGPKFLPLVGSIFIFIFTANAIGKVPGLMSPTANINVTLGCALTVWVYYHLQGMKAQGVGGYIWKGINSRDGVAVVSTVTVLVIVYLLVNLLVDLLYGVLDPRISHD